MMLQMGMKAALWYQGDGEQRSRPLCGRVSGAAPGAEALSVMRERASGLE